MNPSRHVDNTKKDILILDEGPTQGLDGNYADCRKNIQSTLLKIIIFLSLHYNTANSYLFINGTKIHKFKANDSEIKAVPLCLGNIPEDFSVANILVLTMIIMMIVMNICFILPVFI